MRLGRPSTSVTYQHAIRNFNPVIPQKVVNAVYGSSFGDRLVGSLIRQPSFEGRRQLENLVEELKLPDSPGQRNRVKDWLVTHTLGYQSAEVIRLETTVEALLNDPKQRRALCQNLRILSRVLPGETANSYPRERAAQIKAWQRLGASLSRYDGLLTPAGLSVAPGRIMGMGWGHNYLPSYSDVTS